MGSITVLLGIVSTLLPLIKQGVASYHELKDIYESVRKAHAENRDLTDDEFTDLMARLRSAGDELDKLGAEE